MSDEIKTISAAEFQRRGFLQEINRQFLHPLGMALAVMIDEETGKSSFAAVWDSRDDPEGFIFAEDNPPTVAKATETERLKRSKKRVRLERFGWVIQPLTDEPQGQ